jgi:hypothetical protein
VVFTNATHQKIKRWKKVKPTFFKQKLKRVPSAHLRSLLLEESLFRVKRQLFSPYIHTYIHTHTHAYIHTQTRTHTQTHTHTHTRTLHTYIDTDTDTDAPPRARAHTHTHTPSVTAVGMMLCKIPSSSLMLFCKIPSSFLASSAAARTSLLHLGAQRTLCCNVLLMCC